MPCSSCIYCNKTTLCFQDIRSLSERFFFAANRAVHVNQPPVGVEMGDCLFCKIIAGDIPANKRYEDDDVFAFWDISPQAPTHFMVIPKKHLSRLSDLDEEDEKLMGKVIRKGAELASENGIGEGFRVILNDGAKAGQLVFHVHMHILGGRPMNWPPG